MTQKRLGADGPEVSRLGIGGNVFGYFCDGPETRRILDVALDNGVNFVDTADVYSDGRSEELIGAAIAGQRDRWFIASKVGVETGRSGHGIGRPETIRSRLEASLSRLGTEYIDLYQMHHFDPSTPIAETMEALSDLVGEGKIRFIGVTNYTGVNLHSAVKASRQANRAPVSTTQNLYHVLKRDIEGELIPSCKENGVSVIAYGVMARGILADNYRHGAPPPDGSRATTSANVRADLDQEVLSVVSGLQDFAQGTGRSAAHLALAWVLREPAVCTALLGVRNEEQLLSAIPGSQWLLSDDEVGDIESIIGDSARFAHLALGAR